MTVEITHEPVGLRFVSSDGVQRWGAVDPGQCPALAGDLLAGLVCLIHPHGTLASRGGIQRNLISARRMVSFLSERGWRGGAGQLPRARLAEFWMGCRADDEQATRAMLKAWDGQSAGLDPSVRDLVTGRPFHTDPTRPRPLAPYSEAEWSRLIAACAAHIDQAYAGYRSGRDAARDGVDPRQDGVWSPANIRWLLAGRGPVSVEGLHRRGVVLPRPVGAMRAALAQARAELFPGPQVVVSYQLLFGAYSGIVPDGIDDLGVADVDWAGDATVLLSYVKGRTSSESLNLPGAAVRLLQRWLEHSTLLRAHAPAAARSSLWVRQRPNLSSGMEVGKIRPDTVRQWVTRRGLLDDSGQPLQIHRQRIRTTFHSHRDRRSWTGSSRATIDPNHSPGVEGDNYLSATTAAQRNAVEAIIEDAQGDVLRRAQPAIVLSQADTVTLIRDYPQTVARLDLDETVIAQLVGGERDVFVAACADQLTGLHGPKGKPCPARPWVCLLCPLAVFGPRHAPNLLRLKAFFARQWRAMPAGEFMTVFGPYAQRITEILDRFDPAVLADAARHVADTDAELPLRPEDRTG